MWGLTSQPIRHSDKFWREFHTRENEGTEREAPGPALGISRVHEVIFRRAEVFVLAEVCLPRRPHAGQPRSDV